MQLNGMISGANVGNFFDSVELHVIDTDIPQGRQKPTHKVKVYEGLPGLSELRKLVAQRKQQFGQGYDPHQDQDVVQAAAAIQLPQDFTPVSVVVFDITGKGKYISLVGQLI